MSAQNSELQLYKDALIRNNKENPNSYQANFELGMFMSSFRVSAVDSIAFLLTALRLAATDEDKTQLLSRLYVAFGYAGDRENEFRVIQVLATSFPQYLKVFRSVY